MTTTLSHAKLYALLHGDKKKQALANEVELLACLYDTSEGEFKPVIEKMLRKKLQLLVCISGERPEPLFNLKILLSFIRP